MEVASAYPYVTQPPMMPDGPPRAGANTAGHTNKRRRVEQAPEGLDGKAYDHQWGEESRNRSTQPYTSTQNVSFTAAPAEIVNNHPDPAAAAPSALGGVGSLPASEPSSWQQSVASDYPDLGSYQQQPYFNANTIQAGFQPTWSQATPQPYGESTVSVSYPVTEPSTTTTMPFLSPPNNRTPNDSTDALPAASSFAYDSQPASEYAPYTQPSATATLAQREAAKSSSYYFDDASMHLKIQSLPILDNLATHLIHTISKASFAQIQGLMSENDSEDSQAYKTLKDLFDQTRKVYSRDTAFIDAIAIQMFQPNQQEIIRKANIATFISSILGAHDVSFFHLNEFFMETFVPLGHRLLKWQGAIYLDLKTQIYISALMNSDGSPEAMLDELFPPDLDAQILTRHPDAPSLSPSEQDFIDRSRLRKSYLLAEPSSNEAVRELPRKYQWSDFVREFASCITKNVDGIMNVPVRSQGSLGTAMGRSGDQGLGPNGGVNGASGGAQPFNINGKPGQNSSNAENRKGAPAASTIRQPWTKSEEDALLSGLERVNGPHWSQILALYGRGGSVSEVLKDRNQVQLKDKARNLKLWYLKTGKEVPPALRGVTGELRKRGGARARAAMGIVDEDQEAGAEDNDGGEGEGAAGHKDASKARAKKKTGKK